MDTDREVHPEGGLLTEVSDGLKVSTCVKGRRDTET